MSAGYERGRAFNLCVLATSHVRADAREAVRVGEEAVGIVETLASQRTHSHLRELAHRLYPHAELAEVAAFRERVRVLTKRA